MNEQNEKVRHNQNPVREIERERETAQKKFQKLKTFLNIDRKSNEKSVEFEISIWYSADKNIVCFAPSGEIHPTPQHTILMHTDFISLILFTKPWIKYAFPNLSCRLGMWNAVLANFVDFVHYFRF